MKTLELKKLGTFDYKSQLAMLLKSAPTEGFSMGDVSMSVKAQEKLEKAKGKVEFEDTEMAFIKKTVEKNRFRFATKELAEFLDDIKTV